MASKEERNELALYVVGLIAFAAFLILSACAFSPSQARTMDSRYLYKEPIGDDYKAAEDDADAEIEAAGFSIREREDGYPMSTLVPIGVLLLEGGFEGRPQYQQAIVKRHEVVHVRQLQADGRHRFTTKILNESRRFEYEMQGYRQTVRDLCSRDVPRLEILTWIETRAQKFPKQYAFRPKTHERVTELARDALTLELDSCEGAKE